MLACKRDCSAEKQNPLLHILELLMRISIITKFKKSAFIILKTCYPILIILNTSSFLYSV